MDFKINCLIWFYDAALGAFHAAALQKVNHFTSSLTKKLPYILKDVHIDQNSVIIKGSSEHYIFTKEILPLLERPICLQ